MKIKPVTKVNEMAAYRQQQRKQMPTRDAFETVLDAAAMVAESGDDFFHNINHKALSEAIDIVEDFKNDLIRRN